MTRGVKVTNGSDIPSAPDLSFVVNTRYLGAMKIHEKRVFIPNRDATSQMDSNYYNIVYPHRLEYVPAVLCFQGDFPGVGWQNEALIFTASANADAKNVYITSDFFLPTTPIYLFIFAEKVSDS